MAFSLLKKVFVKDPIHAVRQRRRRINLADHSSLYPIYAIGDVHGCLDQLIDAEARILQDLESSGNKGLVILLGDYVDRGSNSAGVLAHLRQPCDPRVKRIALCGNHDDTLSSLLDHPDKLDAWIAAGGRATLMSYGLDIDYLTSRFRSRSSLPNARLAHLISEAIPEDDFFFLKGLPVSAQIGRHLFVHAGIRPGVEMDSQSDEDMMWIREPFISSGPGLDLVVVHGHTASRQPSMGPNRIGIDTKAYATGVLTVLKIDGSSTTIL